MILELFVQSAKIVVYAGMVIGQLTELLSESTYAKHWAHPGQDWSTAPPVGFSKARTSYVFVFSTWAESLRTLIESIS